MDEQAHVAFNTDNVKNDTDLAAAQQAVEAKKEAIAAKTEQKSKEYVQQAPTSCVNAHHGATDARMKDFDAAEKSETVMARLEAEKKNALVSSNECFVPLHDDPAVAGADKLLNRLENQMKGMGDVDESLQKAAPNALVKQVADRGGLDNMALISLDKIFKKLDAVTTTMIENTEAMSAQAHTTKDDAKAAEESAIARKKASQDALAAAKDELKELHNTVKEYVKALKGDDKRGSEIESDMSRAETGVEGFDAFVLKQFTFLKDRAAEKPEEEAAEDRRTVPRGLMLGLRPSVLKVHASTTKDDAEAVEERTAAAKKASQDVLVVAKAVLKELNKTVKEHVKALKAQDKRVSEIDALVHEQLTFLKDLAAEKPEEDEGADGNPYAKFEVLQAPAQVGDDAPGRKPFLLNPRALEFASLSLAHCQGQAGPQATGKGETDHPQQREGKESDWAAVAHARALVQRPRVVSRLLDNPIGKVAKVLRMGTLEQLTSIDREVLGAKAVDEWGADFVTFVASNGTTYRVELREGAHRQINLATGTVRTAYREPPPLPPGMVDWSWAALTAPGHTWQYEAAFRESEVCDGRRFPSAKALSDASVRVPYPTAISSALEALMQAQMRAEIPESERE